MGSKNQIWFVAFVNFHVLNILITADFKLPMQSWEKIHNLLSGASVSELHNTLFLFSFFSKLNIITILLFYESLRKLGTDLNPPTWSWIGLSFYPHFCGGLGTFACILISRTLLANQTDWGRGTIHVQVYTFLSKYILSLLT